MLDEVRDHVRLFLAAHQYCVMTVCSGESTAALLARYRSRGVDVDCLLPLWTEVTYCLELQPQVTIVIPPGPDDAACWLQFQGRAETLDTPDWEALLPAMPVLVRPSDLFRVVRVRPTRIDLVDEGQGWGARETLELL
jgi:hypothetical protein